MSELIRWRDEGSEEEGGSGEWGVWGWGRPIPSLLQSPEISAARSPSEGAAAVGGGEFDIALLIIIIPGDGCHWGAVSRHASAIGSVCACVCACALYIYLLWSGFCATLRECVKQGDLHGYADLLGIIFCFRIYLFICFIIHDVSSAREEKICLCWLKSNFVFFFTAKDWSEEM